MRAWLPIGVVAVALAIVARAWAGLVVTPAIPDFDAADYLVRALRMLDGEPHAVLRPDLHPFGWPLALAAWMGAFGRSVLVARALPVVLALVAVAQLVSVGRKADPERGAVAGAVAGLVALCTSEHLRLLTAPMSEPLALVATLAALGAAIDTVDAKHPWPHLRLGLLVLAGALVRYNLPPMIVAPALLHRVATRRTLDVAPFLWVAPTLLAFLAWEVAEPGVLRQVVAFSQNLDSNLSPLQDLAWVPRSLAADYAGWPAAIVGMALFVAALRRPSPPAALLLAAWVIVGVVAIALHPYKLARTLHPVVPVATLVVTLAFARAPRRALAVAGVAGAAWAAWQLGPGVARLRGRVEFEESPASVAVVEGAVRAAEGGARVKVVSSGRHVAYPAVEAAIRMRGLPATAQTTPPPLNRALDGDYRAPLAEALNPLVADRTVWLAVADDEVYKKPEKPGVAPPESHPSVPAAAAFDEAASARGLRLLDRVDDPAGLTNARLWTR